MTTNNDNETSESQLFCLSPTDWPSSGQRNLPARFPKVSSASEPSTKPSKEPKQLTLDFSRKVTVCVNAIGRTIGEDHIRAKYTNDEVEDVLRLREEGYSLAKIARMTDIPIRTIRGYLDGSRRGQHPAAWKAVKRI